MADGNGKTKNRRGWTDIISTIIASCALLVSAITLYLVYLDKGSLDVSLSDAMVVYFEQSYTITERSLKSLRSEGLPDDVHKNLESMKDQEIVGWKRFLNRLKKKIGQQQTDKYEPMISKYAKKEDQPWEFTVFTILYNTGSPYRAKTIDDARLRLKLSKEKEIVANWFATTNLLPETEYVRLYGVERLPKEHVGYPDYFVKTASRRLPFRVTGKETVLKWLSLRPKESIDSDLAPFDVEAHLEVKTISGDVYSSGKRVYHITKEHIARGKRTKTYQWVLPRADKLATDQRMAPNNSLERDAR